MKFSNLLKRNKNNQHNSSSSLNSKQYLVNIPKERIICADMQLNNKPYVGVFNEAIMELQPKHIFGWYLSIIIDYESKANNGMPYTEDSAKMQDFCDCISTKLANDPEHPNALFLGRVTGDGYTQMLWYINNPEIANNCLQSLIKSNSYPFHFNFEMTQDIEWNEAHFWLDHKK